MARHFLPHLWDLDANTIGSNAKINHTEISEVPWDTNTAIPSTMKAVWLTSDTGNTQVTPFLYCTNCREYKYWYKKDEIDKVKIVSITNLKKHKCQLKIKTRKMRGMIPTNLSQEQREKCRDFMAKQIVENPMIPIQSGTDVINEAMEFGARMAMSKDQLLIYDVDRHGVSDRIGLIGEKVRSAGIKMYRMVKFMKNHRKRRFFHIVYFCCSYSRVIIIPSVNNFPEK